jgi:hypothetical protein
MPAALCQPDDANAWQAFAARQRGQIKRKMSALWVLLEVVSLAALLVLACVAVLARRKSRANFGGDADEPDWWSDFEREFALYAASQEAARSAEPAPRPPSRRPRHSG